MSDTSQQKAFVKDVAGRFGVRRYHTDQTRLCENCQIVGSPDRRLLRCRGCEYSWYCSPACQKEHWKVHKSICKRYQEERESVPDEFNKVYQALRDWVRQKDPALGFAANEALLPAKDLPDRNLLDTHVLVVNLAESPKDSGKFDVLQVRVAPHKELKDNFRMLSGNDEQYFELINNLARMREGTEKRMGKKLYGTVYTMIRCVIGDRLAMQVHPYFIKQEAVDEKMKENARKDWVEQFKAYVSAGQRFFQTPDGAVFMVGGL